MRPGRHVARAKPHAAAAALWYQDAIVYELSVRAFCDRDGVRTPMQWSADRNAGFSQGNPQQLYLPLIVDHEYHHESVHVEAQQRNSHSLLW